MCNAQVWTKRLNLILTTLEEMTHLGPTKVAVLLGIAYPTYAQYRSGRRELPAYHTNQAELLHLLTRDQLAAYIERKVYGTRET